MIRFMVHLGKNMSILSKSFVARKDDVRGVLGIQTFHSEHDV